MFSRSISHLLAQQFKRTIQLPACNTQAPFRKTFCMPISYTHAPLARTFSASALQSRYLLLKQQNAGMCCHRRMASSSGVRREGGPGSPVTWKSAVVLLSVGAAMVWYVRVTRQEQEEVRDREKKKSVGMPAIGGPFELLDQDGKTVTQDDFLGKWLLLYFGFCHCPDICPDQLDKQAAIIDKVDERLKGKSLSAAPLQPLFLSVDPARDDVPAVKEYIEEFHPRLIGLTGSVEQVKSACKAFRIYFSSGQPDQDNDYIVDHSVVMYLLDPNGQFVAYYGQDRKVRDIVNDIYFKMEGFC